jgi:hypothetical protein
VASALTRFRSQLFPVVAGHLSHLVVETWISTGDCGEPERAVTADIERTTERPAATGNEIVDLLQEAKRRGIAPRVLQISCADYAALQEAGGAVDYDRTLRMTARALERALLGALRDRARGGGTGGTGGSAGSAGGGTRAVALYGGALHNDLYPEPSLAAYSLAPTAVQATLGRYLEIDLVVPRFAAASAAVRAEAWYRAYLRTRRPGQAALVRRSERSYVLVFPGEPGEGGAPKSPAR